LPRAGHIPVSPLTGKLSYGKRMVMRPPPLGLALLAFLGCQQQVPAQVPSPRAGPPVRSAAVPLAGADEPGERLTFAGRVLDYAGRPLAEAAVVAYHADAGGLYNPPDAGTRVPRLRAVAVTDIHGGFRFATVRPGAYPDGSEPAHIHLEVTAPAHRLRYVTFWFEGDPLITPAMRRRADRDAEIRIVRPARDSTGGWSFAYDIGMEGN
jgi:protocatechuate 3,4-dioxygenase beta subunit